jgi:hypothetical protein
VGRWLLQLLTAPEFQLDLVLPVDRWLLQLLTALGVRLLLWRLIVLGVQLGLALLADLLPLRRLKALEAL